MALLIPILLILSMIIAVGYRFSAYIFGANTYAAKWFYFNGSTGLCLVLCILLALHVKESIKWYVWSLCGLLAMYLIRDSFYMGEFEVMEWAGVGLFIVSIAYKQIKEWLLL